jgi:hypothetical protein
VPLDDDSPLAAAARTGEAVLLPDEAALRAGYPHLADGWIGLGFQATANLPLRDREGALIGALGIAWNHAVDTDELTDLLATVAGIAGQTLDRARLVDRVTTQARRSSAMAELAEVLATARSADEVAVAITRHAAAVVDAARANLALVADGGELLVHHGDQVTDEIRARFSRVPADAPVPHVDAIREHRLLTFASRADFGQRYPDLVGVVEQAGGEAIAVAPLRDSAGRDTGPSASCGPIRSRRSTSRWWSCAASPTCAPRRSNGPCSPTPSTASR